MSNRRKLSTSYSQKARAAFPDYVVRGEPCDVPSCTGKVSGSRTITIVPKRQQDGPLSILIRLCAEHTDAPYDDLLGLLPKLNDMAEAVGPIAYLGPDEQQNSTD